MKIHKQLKLILFLSSELCLLLWSNSILANAYFNFINQTTSMKVNVSLVSASVCGISDPMGGFKYYSGQVNPIGIGQNATWVGTTSDGWSKKCVEVADSSDSSNNCTFHYDYCSDASCEPGHFTASTPVCSGMNLTHDISGNETPVYITD